MTTKDDLLHLVDALSADEDEPLTDDQLARVEAGEAEIRRGEFVTFEDVRRRLEL